MGAGCRDCRTCTMAGGARFGMNLGLGLLYVYLVGIPWLIRRAVVRRCPTCGHSLKRHLAPLPTVVTVPPAQTWPGR